jgi:hypothetical protein
MMALIAGVLAGCLVVLAIVAARQRRRIRYLNALLHAERLHHLQAERHGLDGTVWMRVGQLPRKEG